MGLEEEAVFFLLQRAISKHQIRSAFTRGSIRGSIYVEGILDVDTISLLNSTPGIIRMQSGIVRQSIDSSDWVKLLTMQDSITVVKAGQWIRVRTGLYKGDLGDARRLKLSDGNTHVPATFARFHLIFLPSRSSSWSSKVTQIDIAHH